MTDYEKLVALWDEYETELNRRKRGVPYKVWNGSGYTETMIAPNNKARLNRLRLEISRMMLEIERQMTGRGKEAWF